MKLQKIIVCQAKAQVTVQIRRGGNLNYHGYRCIYEHSGDVSSIYLNSSQEAIKIVAARKSKGDRICFSKMQKPVRVCDMVAIKLCEKFIERQS